MKLFINTTAELKKYIADINISKSASSLLPAISDAQHQYIMPEIGIDLYKFLMEKINADQKGGNKLTPEVKELLDEIAKPLAWFTYHNLLKGGVIQLGDAGIKETNPTETSPVRQWVLQSALENAIQKADMYLDNLLMFLEANANTYPIWKKSHAYTESTELFLNSTEEFQQFEDIGSSRRLFKIIRYQIRSVEQSHILPLLGEALFYKIKTDYKKQPTTTNQQQTNNLIELIQSALAAQSLLQSLSRININISFQGLTFVRSDNGIVRKDGKFTEEGAHYTWFARDLEQQAKGKLAQLLKFVLSNQNSFPEFRSSKYYIPEKSIGEKNANHKGIFRG